MKIDNNNDTDTSSENIKRSRVWEEFNNGLKEVKNPLKILLAILWVACVVGMPIGFHLDGGLGILTAFVWFLTLHLLLITFVFVFWSVKSLFLKIICRTLVVLVLFYYFHMVYYYFTD